MTGSSGHGGPRSLPPALRDLVADACGRGYTVLCTIPDRDLLAALAAAAGPTGLTLALGEVPPSGAVWSTVRCQPDSSIPLRSHVVDLAVITESPDLAGLCEEVRRALAPGADVRAVAHGDANHFSDALLSASIRPLRATAHDGIHLIAARGP